MRDEAKLATVTLRGAGAQRAPTVDVWLVDGRVFSLAFSTPPQTLPAGTEPDDVWLWLDPMVAGAQADPASLGVRLPEGARAIRTVVLDDGDYVVVAARGARMLALRAGDATSTFYLLDAEGDDATPEPAGNDYRAALARLDTP